MIIDTRAKLFSDECLEHKICFNCRQYDETITLRGGGASVS